MNRLGITNLSGSMNKALRFSCLACGKRLKAPTEHAGRWARCSCGQAVVVPFPESVPEMDGITENSALLNEQFDAIRNEFHHIASSYLESLSQSERSPISLLKEKDLIRLLLPLFQEKNDNRTRATSWVKPRLGQFRQSFDRAFQGQSPETRLARAKSWHQELTAARDVLFEQYQLENAKRLRRFQRKELFFKLGLLLGVCVLGLAAGLARAQVFPWPIAVIIIAVYFVVYIAVSCA